MNDTGTKLREITGSLLGSFFVAYLFAYLASRVYEGVLVKKDTYTREKVLAFRRSFFGACVRRTLRRLR